MITKHCPINLAYKPPLAMPPPKRGHLSRTGHIGGGLYATVAKKHSNGTLADPIKSYTAATRMLLELPRNRLVHSVGD